LMTIPKGQILYFDGVLSLGPVFVVIHRRHFYLIVITHFSSLLLKPLSVSFGIAFSFQFR
jgi:hypothetical protein